MELIVFCSCYYYVTIVVGTTLRELFLPSSQCFCILARNGYSLLISPDEVSLDHDTERKKPRPSRDSNLDHLVRNDTYSTMVTPLGWNYNGRSVSKSLSDLHCFHCSFPELCRYVPKVKRKWGLWV